MDETLYGSDEPAPGATTAIAGDRLRAAREKTGLSLTDVSARTRIPLRQLEAVEQGRYDRLPSPTYAVGFAKAYARAVGVDEVAIAAAVRAEIARIGVRQPEYEPYEVPDPARIPSRGLVIVAAGAALAVLILLGLWYGTGLFNRTSGPAGVAETPVAAAPDGTPTATAVPAAPTTAAVPPATGGHVQLTAAARVWLRVYDADDKTLFLGTMNPGDHFDVPADANGPMVNIGRPDKLTVTLDGRPAPALGASDHAIKDVKVDGASVAARLSAAPAASATSTLAAGAAPASAPEDGSAGTTERPHDRSERHRNRSASGESETRRANRESAMPPPAAATPPGPTG